MIDIISHFEHQHAEIMIVPSKYHSSMLLQQYTFACHKNTHTIPHTYQRNTKGYDNQHPDKSCATKTH